MTVGAVGATSVSGGVSGGSKGPLSDAELGQYRAETRIYEYALERYEQQRRSYRPGRGPEPVPPQKSAWLLEAESRLAAQQRVEVVTSPPVVDGEVVKGDPLRATAAVGGVFPDLAERRYEDQMDEALSKGFDIPGSVQAGPTCGLQLLVSIFDGIQAKHPDAKGLLNPMVRAEDEDRDDAFDSDIDRDTDQHLLPYAQAKGYSVQGEVFTADDMAAIARNYGYQASVKTGATVADLKAVVARGNAAMIAMDVDREGNPGLFEGRRAHWVAVEGVFQEGGVDYVVATHTWEGAEYVWRADELLASTNQLQLADKTLFPKAPDDLRKTLAGRLIEISD